MSDNWYRNQTWNESIEIQFETKLRRARRKEQYLRVQACLLARTHPEVALKLLERYFELPTIFDRAAAHVDRATALLAMDQFNEAIDSYEAALQREIEFPNSLTQAYLELPFLIATRRMRERYPRAREVLDTNEHRLTLPVEHFRWHAAQALIAADTGNSVVGKRHAERACQAATMQHSGFRYHPTIGLVTAEFEKLLSTLKQLRGR